MVHPSQQSPAARRRKPQACVSVTLNGRVRTVPIRPWAAISALSAFILFLSAYVGATGYLIYRDDLLGATLSRQVRMQYAYEDRIAALRSEIDRVTTRNLVKAHGVEEQLALLLERQAELNERQSSLAALVKEARATGIKLPEEAAAAQGGARAIESGDGLNRRNGAALAYARERQGRDVIGGTLMRGSEPGDDAHPARALAPVMASVGDSLDSMQDAQAAALDVLTAASESKLGEISSALAPLGARLEQSETAEPQGGPFVPAGPLHFVERTAMLSRTLGDIAALQRAALRMPLRAPVAGGRVSSRFGYRTDPFLNRQALHSGLDFAAPAGAAVHAAGAGVVTSAGWSGGYGQLVEIRHADGMVTRYGHLSAILVREGAEVEAGSLIGRVGSTGRSTGPHLHYETRRDGEAVDPAIFLAAGRAF